MASSVSPFRHFVGGDRSFCARARTKWRAVMRTALNHGRGLFPALGEDFLFRFCFVSLQLLVNIVDCCRCSMKIVVNMEQSRTVFYRDTIDILLSALSISNDTPSLSLRFSTSLYL